MEISLTQLRHFVSLADHGSFSRGAERSLRSQAAFSRSIAALEAQVGATLVDRVGHKSELTPLGRILLDHARNVIANVDGLARTAEEYAEGSGGSFRLGLGSTPAAIFTVPLLRHVATHRRNMRVTITTGQTELLVEALRGRRLDALLVEVKSVPPTLDLEFEQIAQLRTGLLCRAGHPLAHRTGLHLRDLGRWPVASTYMSHDVIRFMMENYGFDSHPERLVSLQCGDVPSLLEVVRSTDALFIGVLAPAREALRSGELIAVKLPVEPPPSVFSIVTLRGRARPLSFPTIRAIIDDTFAADDRA